MKRIEEIAAQYGVHVFRDGTVSLPYWEKVLEKSEDFRQLATKNTTSRWHQEKNMLTHTKFVCENIKSYIDQDKEMEDEYKLILMLAAMFHDIGKCKCDTAPDGKLLSAGHPAISERICRKTLWGLDVTDRERICELVRLHDLYCSSDISDRKLKTKIEKMSIWLFTHIYMLEKLWLADDLGAIKDPELEGSAMKMVNRVNDLLNTCDFHRIPSENTNGLSKDFEIYVMCGLPGSGKSTWCAEHLKDLPVVSRDEIREELGMTEKGVKFMGTPEQEDLVSKISDGLVNELCRHRKSFVYDNMNSREKYRRSFYEKVRKFKPIMRYVYLEVSDLSVLEARRPEIACKGDTVFEDMVYKMEFPRPDEYDILEIYQDLSDPAVPASEAIVEGTQQCLLQKTHLKECSIYEI